MYISISESGTDFISMNQNLVSLPVSKMPNYIRICMDTIVDFVFQRNVWCRMNKTITWTLLTARLTNDVPYLHTFPLFCGNVGWLHISSVYISFMKWYQYKQSKNTVLTIETPICIC